MDHVTPFFHLDPLRGGLTRFGNIQPVCSKHHALKTAGRLRVTMPNSWELDYEFRHGISTKVTPPEQPVNIAQALEFAALADMRPERWRVPRQMVPPAPTVLELMPGESTIRQRDEAKRRAEEKAAKNRRLSRAFRQQRAARQRLMVQRCLDWDNAVFQPCLLPGSKASSMKQLTGNRYVAEFTERARRRSRAASGARRATGTMGAKGTQGPNGAKGPATRVGGSSTAEPETSRQWLRSGPTDPWDVRYTGRQVNWDHDLETDPPPF